MMHIIIKQERRTTRLALPINADLHTPNGKTVNGMPQFDVTPQPPQLHMQGAEIKDWTNIEYAASWNGVDPWITVLKGDKSSIKMAYMGWPMLTKEEWDALNPVVFPTL